jgi:hypothetical protein
MDCQFRLSLGKSRADTTLSERQKSLRFITVFGRLNKGYEGIVLFKTMNPCSKHRTYVSYFSNAKHVNSKLAFVYGTTGVTFSASGSKIRDANYLCLQLAIRMHFSSFKIASA